MSWSGNIYCLLIMKSHLKCFVIDFKTLNFVCVSWKYSKHFLWILDRLLLPLSITSISFSNLHPYSIGNWYPVNFPYYQWWFQYCTKIAVIHIWWTLSCMEVELNWTLITSSVPLYFTCLCISIFLSKVFLECLSTKSFHECLCCPSFLVACV